MDHCQDRLTVKHKGDELESPVMPYDDKLIAELSGALAARAKRTVPKQEPGVLIQIYLSSFRLRTQKL